ncbi:MAG: MATE family efflux transporter, partial [Gemmatimonadota bacterium]
AIGLLAAGWRELRDPLRARHPEVWHAPPLWRMLELGAPIGVQYFLEYGIFGLVALLMGLIGTTEMAGHQVALNLAALTFNVPLGVSTAAAVLLGQAVGRGDAGAARQAAMIAYGLGVGFMVLSAITMLAIPETLARIYTDDTGVLAMAAALIPLAGLFQVFDGMQVVGSGVLRGLGDTRAPMVVSLLGFWLLGLPTSVYLGFGTPLGPRGLWWGLVVGLAAVAVFLAVRVKRRLNHTLRRVVIDVTPSAIG